MVQGGYNMKIVIAGGSGFLGRMLIERLTESNHSVVVLSRNPKTVKHTLPKVEVESWDAASLGTWTQRVDGADAVINLTGESIAGKRWSKKQKDLISSSRVSSTRALVEAIDRAKKRPAILVNASAVGFYGDVPDGDVTEDHPKGNDFLADVCGRWEFEAKTAEKYGVRVVLLRTGIVLDKNGGALQKLLLPFNLFIGGPLGSGKQWFPWIHLEDEVGAIAFALENKSLSGSINLAAPDPVTMRQFCSALGKAMHRPSWAPVPGFVLKAILGEMADSLLLGGQRAIPRKLLESGYKFRFPNLPEALADIYRA